MKFTHIEVPEVRELTAEMIHGRRYYTTPEGNKYPSITTVLGAKGKDWLNNWRNMLGAEKADKETQRCADRGTAIHDMIEKYLENEEEPTKGYSREHVGLFNQVRLRLNQNVNNIRIQEAPLYSDRLGIAGRVDCIGEYEGKLSVIDFKTSNGNKTSDMIEDYYLQCTAYAIMYYEMYGVLIEDIVIIMAVEKGMMPLVFKAQIYDYIDPLMERIDYFNNLVKGDKK